MSSRLAIPCPYCKRPMATSPAFAGQMIACPSCRGEFVLTIPAIVAFAVRRAGSSNFDSDNFESACLPVRDATFREHRAAGCSSS